MISSFYLDIYRERDRPVYNYFKKEKSMAYFFFIQSKSNWNVNGENNCDR